MFTTVATKKNQFWRLLEKTGWISTTPLHMMRFTPYGISLKDMPDKLRTDIEAALKWKQSDFARNRPKYGKIRAITARNDRLILQQLTSYVVKVCNCNPQALTELIQQENIEGFVEWMINERRIKGDSIHIARRSSRWMDRRRGRRLDYSSNRREPEALGRSCEDPQGASMTNAGCRLKTENRQHP
jgi:hypothetical protein